jgi:hypothetical protein
MIGNNNIQNVWVSNVPCNKDLKCLRDFYNDYESLKDYLFDLFIKTRVFEDIGRDKKILIKPNWVCHCKKETDELCLTTNQNIVLIVLEYITIFKPRSIIIGDSPIQSCDWTLLFSEYFISKINEIQKRHHIIINIVDFRNEKWEQKKILKKNCRSECDYILYDLTSKSLLEPLAIKKKLFRVGDYDPRDTMKNHNIGTHRYLVAREVIDAEVIINLPKLKTHQKAGVTNGLKNYVGVIGEKAYLAHHSSSFSENGGDCFPGNSPTRKAAEYFNEASFKYKGSWKYFALHLLSAMIWRLAPKSNFASLSGSWYGNDTVWRMVWDINKIVKFGKLNGEISNVPERTQITISDAIIAGQGDGPLDPVPHPMGMVSISNSDILLDSVLTEFMGFDSRKIPLMNSFVEKTDNSLLQVYFDWQKISLSDIHKYSIQTIPPMGWVGHIEYQ